MAEFFSNQPTQVPVLPLLVHLALLAMLPVLVWLTWRCRTNKPYLNFFRGLQLVQLVALYSWYAFARDFPLNESLPLYHCRIAMFVVLCLSTPSSFKDYFAFLGLGGSLAAFVYPDFDPYPFWHVTIFSFIVGHLALWVNGLMYIMTSDRRQALDFRQVIGYTLMLNLGLLLVNAWTGGNYGFLMRTPLINSSHIALNFVVVSLANIGLVCLVQVLYGWFLEIGAAKAREEFPRIQK